MNTPLIVYKNLRQRALSTVMTAVAIALGVALVTAITCLRQQARDNFDRVAASYELVVGAKGSPLQLVLNTVYHLDVPVGNIPFGYYQTLKNDWRVQYAVPFALGDNYQGFRLVGTEAEYFKFIELRGGQKLTLAEGKVFEGDYQAVFGSEAAAEAAKRAGLKVGGKFIAKHGVQDTVAGEEHDHDPFTMVGILKPTGTPIDRVIFISLGSVDEIHKAKPDEPKSSADLAEELSKLPDSATVGEDGETPKAPTTTPVPEKKAVPEKKKSGHDHDHDDHDHHDKDDHDHDKEKKDKKDAAAGTAKKKDDHKDGHDDHHDHDHGPITEVTAVIVKLKSPAFMFQLHREINRGQVAQAAYPGIEVGKLFNIVRSFDSVLLVISLLVVIVAATFILVTIYNSLSERRRDLAVMRALGARRMTIFSWLLLEAAAISALGAGLGVLFGHFILLGLQQYAKGVSGIEVSAWKTISLSEVAPRLGAVPGELAMAVGVVLLGAVMGLLPAILAYRTNVSRNLSA